MVIEPCSSEEEIMATTIDTRLQAKTLQLSLTVDDLQQSIRFFEGLGFAVDERWEHEGALIGVMMRAGEALVGLNQDDWKKGHDRQKGVGVRLLLSTTQDIDQLAADARKAGIALTSEVRDTQWGSRAFEVTEPTGFRLTIFSQV